MKLFIAKFIYQMIWFGILSQIYKRKITTNILVDNSKRFVIQLKFAKQISNLFNVKILVLMGDSNSEVFSNYRSAMGFKAIAVTLGVGGTRPDTWSGFLNKYLIDVVTIRQLLNDLDIIWNIGGNSALQGAMDIAYDSLQELFRMFPKSYNITIPPIHYSVLKPITEDRAKSLEGDVNTLNSYIIDLWKENAIDLGAFFKNPHTGEAWIGTLSDPVHYGNSGKIVITEFINGFVIPKLNLGI